MNGKAKTRGRVRRTLACLAVAAGTVLASVAPARAASDTGIRTGSGQGTPTMEAVPTFNISLNPLSAYAPAEVSAAFERITQEAAAEQGKIGDLKIKYVMLSRHIDSDNQKSAALVQRDNSLTAAGNAIKKQQSSLNAEIERHNAEPHVFQIPAEQEAATAYRVEAEALNFRQSVLKAQLDSIVSQLSQLGNQENALADDEDAVNADIDAYNQQVDAVNASQQRLAGEAQQLFEQEARTEQSVAVNPPDPAVSMNAGGDAPFPSRQPGQGAGDPGGDTGGDSPSALPQVSALREYARQNGTQVITEPGTATLTPGSVSRLPASQAVQLGSPAGTYDGLAPEPNGHYKALKVRTPGDTLSPRQQAFESAIDRGGQARTTVDGRPSIIDKFSFSPSVHDRLPWRDRIPSRGGQGKAQCLTERSYNNGVGWIYNTWQDVDHKNIEPRPYGPKGIRATQGSACLTRSQGKGSNAQGNITGWQDASNKVSDPVADLARCHIIANIVGGKGTRKNLFPCYQVGTNTGTGAMRWPYEAEVQAAADSIPENSGEAVYYVVTPWYHNRESTIPWAVELSAEIQLPDEGSEPIFDPSTIVLANVPKKGRGANLGN